VPDGWATISDDALVARFTGVKQWQRRDQRAPHKPLLLLYALAAVQRGERGPIGFDRIEGDLGRLLRDFGPPNPTTPHYPFWHLTSDGLWDIPEMAVLQADVEAKAGRQNPRVSVIREVGARGGFPPGLEARLQGDPALVNRIAAALLDQNWEPSYHDDVLSAVGMEWVPVPTRRKRDPAFRDMVLRIYEYRCAVCGFDALMDGANLGLEAAHVHWHSHGGADAEDNGLALCAIHHKAFDRGAIGLDDDLRIQVSQLVRRSPGADDWLIRFAGRGLIGPQAGCPAPAAANVAWHRREVFRGPAREACK
jgi:putative restriction endonuclease